MLLQNDQMGVAWQEAACERKARCVAKLPNCDYAILSVVT